MSLAAVRVFSATRAEYIRYWVAAVGTCVRCAQHWHALDIVNVFLDYAGWA